MKLFQLNDADVYMAPSLEEAIMFAMDETGLPRDELCDEPREVTEEELDRRTIALDEGNGPRRTFREQLTLDAAEIGKPCMFATTEY